MRKLSIFTGALLALVSMATAQPYVTGEVTTPNWQPGVGLPTGSGAAADMTIAASAGTDANGIAYSHVLTLPGTGTPSHGLTASTNYQWKIADAAFTGTNFRGTNSRLRTGSDATAAISFYARTAPFGDGLLPEAGGSALSDNAGYLWSSETANVFSVAATWNVIGNFYSATSIVGAANWSDANPANLVLTDAGFGGATDGVWGVSITSVTPGNYECKFFDDNTFSGLETGNDGFGGGNYTFTVLSTADTVDFILDTRTGRGGVVVTSTAPPIPEGYYVVITGPDVNSAVITASPVDSTNKINEASPIAANVIGRTFTIAAPGSYAAQVLYYDGASASPAARYPSEGIGVPFIATAGQEVIVILDQNAYADGFFPSQNLVTVFGNNPRVPLLTFTEVQGVGSWQSETVDGLSGDYNNNDDTWNMTAVGDVYTATYAFNNPSNGNAPVVNPEIKAVARISGVAAGILGSGDWSVQMGGADDVGSVAGLFNGNGLTLNGNNPNLVVTGSFDTTNNTLAVTVDPIWGRMAVTLGASATPPAAPARPAYFSTFTAVEDWSNY